MTFRDEINASEQIKKHKSLTDKIAFAWRRTFGFQPNNRVLSAVYRGRDAKGNPVYEITRRMTGLGNRVIKQRYSLAGEFLQPVAKPTPGHPRGGGGNRPDRQAGRIRLEQVKNQWLAFFTALPDSQIAPNTRSAFIRNIQNFQGDAEDLDRNMRMASQSLPAGKVAIDPNAPPPADDWLNDFISGLGDGGGGGGGFAGPAYRAPDRRVVEDMVKGMMVSLVGQVLDDRVDTITNVYMKDHRRNFDSMSAEIDPAQSVMEAIRNTEDYRVAHINRPDGEDERNWISTRALLAKRGGLNQEDVDGFAITQATVAGDEGDMIDAAASAQFAQTGSTAGTALDQKMRDVATGMFRNVVL